MESEASGRAPEGESLSQQAPQGQERVVAVVQARLNSSRLPAKVMLDLNGATALERCVRRVQRIAGVQQTVVATTTNAEDDLLEAHCERMNVVCVRGSEHDVLDRYMLAARRTEATAIVRCTADCPLIDPAISALVVAAYLNVRGSEQPADYASNTLVRHLPRGLDTEILSRAALERAHGEATDPAEREHVTLYTMRNPTLFRLVPVRCVGGPDLSHLRWTLDTLVDYHLLGKLFQLLGARGDRAELSEVLSLLEQHPTLTQVNAHIEQKVPA